MEAVDIANNAISLLTTLINSLKEKAIRAHFEKMLQMLVNALSDLTTARKMARVFRRSGADIVHRQKNLRDCINTCRAIFGFGALSYDELFG